MKTVTNIIITHILFLALFGGAALALAQETNSLTIESEESSEGGASASTGVSSDAMPMPPAERRQAMEDRVEEMQENAQERRQQFEENVAEREAEMMERRAEREENMLERRAQLEERAQQRITNLAANVSNRMEAVIGRFNNIIDRTSERIEKLKERGVDTTAAAAALASAQLSVDAAAAEISDIDVQVAAAVGSEDVRTAWAGAKETYLAARDHLRTAHAELRATVDALKAAVEEAQLEAGASAAVRNENADENDQGEDTDE